MFETRSLQRGGRPSSSEPSRSEELQRLGKQPLLRAHRLIVTSREIDDAELRLKRQGAVFFQIGSAGQEVVQAAAARCLRAGKDWVYPYYRDRTLALALGVTVRDMLRQSMAKATDPSSGGRQMPCHYGSDRLRIVSQSSPTGSQFLQAVGTAEAGLLARRLPDGRDVCDVEEGELVYVSGGDGSTSEGEFFEALNLALLRRLPVLFVIEDNGYAISVPVEEQTAGGSISGLVGGFPGLHVEETDGLDFLASYAAFQRATAWCRGGHGPALVHARVVRLCSHSDSDNDLAYRPAAEKKADDALDPLPAFERMLIDAGIAAEEELAEIRRNVREEVVEACGEVAAEPDPDPSSATRYLFNPRIVVTAETPPEEGGPLISMVDAINGTLRAEMEINPRILLFGEDVADVSRLCHLGEVEGKGGVFKVTHGLQKKFGGDRVFNTPLAEASIVGRAVGLAVRGFIPVIEIQFVDFIWPAMNQIRSELCLMRWRSDNHFSCPVVIRAAAGGYVRGGAIYHSQSVETIFCRCPGIHVVMPSSASDAAGLLRTAMRCGDPVLFLEHKHLYRQSYARSPDPGPEHVIPLGRARTARRGEDITLVTYGALVEKSLRAAEELAAERIEIEVIDLRSLRPYDWEAIRDSVARTGRLVVASEESLAFGFGSEIVARAAGELFEYLDAPVERVGSLETHVAYSPVLERATLPQVDDLIRVLRKTARY
ncbi:MAG: dehydrogenase E1 component subunit alpha/beta [Planctomycetes bacterium]|nr:dehydrogenase E1 component subunit alpha/beta [Planctomycetota bacterium]